MRRLPFFTLLFIPFLFVPLALAQQPPKANWQHDWENTLAAAKKEGSVVVYHAPFGEAREVLQKTFKEKYGIDIEFVTGRTGDLVSRITTERKAGIYSVDMMITGLGSFFNLIAPLKITAPIEPLLILPEAIDGSQWRPGKLPLADKARTVVPMSLVGLHYTSINTEMVKEGDLVSVEDVLDPKWKGKILVNDPSIGGPGAEWFTFIMLGVYGEDKGKEYMKKLAEQQPSVIRDERLQVEWVARGKYPIGLGVEPSEVLKMARAGAPVKLLKMKEGKPLGSGALNMMVFDKLPHPNAAKLLANWILTREGGEILSKYSGYLSARLDVSTEGYDPLFVPGPTETLPGEEYKLRQTELLKVAADLFKDLKQ
jgi:iron(III) transport system substrate-binding protein